MMGVLGRLGGFPIASITSRGYLQTIGLAVERHLSAIANSIKVDAWLPAETHDTVER